MKLKIVLLILFALVFINTPGCNSGDTGDMSLNIGVMPAVDAAPIFLAEKLGYFEDLGLDVNIQVFTSGTDRQSALQTNSIDGAISDMVALIVNVQGGFDIKGTMLTDGMFPVLVRENFEEQRDITVALMEVSVVNFLADEWLADKYNIEKVFINEIPLRLEMLKNGSADMGVFPEPVASMGKLDGLTKIIYQAEDGYSPDIFVFTGKALKEKDAAVKAFHLAYNMAVESIKDDESNARDILVEKLQFNPDIYDLIELPEYNEARLPDREYVNKLINWTQNVLQKEITVTESDIFERKYLR